MNNRPKKSQFKTNEISVIFEDGPKTNQRYADSERKVTDRGGVMVRPEIEILEK